MAVSQQRWHVDALLVETHTATLISGAKGLLCAGAKFPGIVMAVPASVDPSEPSSSTVTAPPGSFTQSRKQQGPGVHMTHAPKLPAVLF